MTCNDRVGIFRFLRLVGRVSLLNMGVTHLAAFGQVQEPDFCL